MVEGDVLGGDGVDAFEHSEQWAWTSGEVCNGSGVGNAGAWAGESGAEQGLLARESSG
jgi:hypothetical protein